MPRASPWDFRLHSYVGAKPVWGQRVAVPTTKPVWIHANAQSPGNGRLNPAGGWRPDPAVAPNMRRAPPRECFFTTRKKHLQRHNRSLSLGTLPWIGLARSSAVIMVKGGIHLSQVTPICCGPSVWRFGRSWVAPHSALPARRPRIRPEDKTGSFDAPTSRTHLHVSQRTACCRCLSEMDTPLGVFAAKETVRAWTSRLFG